MSAEPDRARNVCALLALYFGYCSFYALDPAIATSKLAPTIFGLVAVWFALAAVFDQRVDDDARATT